MLLGRFHSVRRGRLRAAATPAISAGRPSWRSSSSLAAVQVDRVAFVRERLFPDAAALVLHFEALLLLARRIAAQVVVRLDGNRNLAVGDVADGARGVAASPASPVGRAIHHDRVPRRGRRRGGRRDPPAAPVQSLAIAIGVAPVGALAGALVEAAPGGIPISGTPVFAGGPPWR